MRSEYRIQCIRMGWKWNETTTADKPKTGKD